LPLCSRDGDTDAELINGGTKDRTKDFEKYN